MSKTLTEHAVTTCDSCDQTDDHPKVHLAYALWKKSDRVSITEPSFHHDCLPQEFRGDLVGPQNANIVAIVEAAESGVRGEELRTFIQTLPNDNNETPEV